MAPAASYITWAMIPVIFYLSRSTEADLTIPLGILGLAGFLFSTASSHLVYQLVNRRNMHFAREEDLLWTALATAKSATLPADMKTRLPLSSAEQNLVSMVDTGREHSAILWALLALIPYVGWIAIVYVLAFLSSDLRKHELREDLVLEDLSRAWKGGGGTDLPTRRKRVPSRPVIAYVILSILTLGIFLLAWLLLTIEDPEAHFEYHRHFEDFLVGPQPVSQGTAGGLF